MFRPSAPVLFLPLILAPACGAPEREPTSGAPVRMIAQQLQAQDFCDAYARRVCDVDVACACEQRELDCLTENLGACHAALITDDLMVAIESGNVVFDANRAERLVEDIGRGATSCEHPLDVIGWRRGDLLDFGGLFVGQVPVGEKCTIAFSGLGPNECAKGVCAPSGDELVCVGLAVPGESCGLDMAGHEYRCFENDPFAGVEAGRPDLMFSPCVEGTCERRRGDDRACEADSWCKSLRCERLVVPTSRVEVSLYLDARAPEVHGLFDPNDAKSFTKQVVVTIVDEEGVEYRAQIFVFHSSPLEWGYAVVVDDEVIGLGAIAFDEHGRLDVEYAVSGGVSFSASPRFEGVEFDFGPSLQEGGNGKDGTRLVARDFAVRNLESDHRVSSPFCAGKLEEGTACVGDQDCRSGVCRGVCQAERGGPAWCW